MTPEQANLVQDAAGLVAAHLRDDRDAQGILLNDYSADEAFPRLVEAFVYYSAAAVQVGAQLANASWHEVLIALPEYHVCLIPGVNPDWEAALALVINVIDPGRLDGGLPAMEVTTCVEATYGLAISVTNFLGQGNLDQSLVWTTRISVLAAKEN